MQFRQAFQYRLYPTHAQITALDTHLRVCRELYNAGLEERREAYKRVGKSLNYYDQANQLKEIRTFRPDLAAVNFSACQDVLRRLDKAFTAFFVRVRRGDTPGFPRFKNRHSYNSITWPSYGDGCKVVADGSVRLQGIGSVRFVHHRAIDGTIKTVTVRRDHDQWFVCFSCAVEKMIPEHHGGPIGIDVGLQYFASMSDGTHVENPRFYRTGQARLAKAQKTLAVLPKNSPLRRHARAIVTLAHRKVRNQRVDFLHKTSTALVHKHTIVVVENLNIANLTRTPKPKIDADATDAGRTVYLPNGAAAKAGLNKSIADAGWGMFVAMLGYKAESAGSTLVKVNPAFTSQTCPECGTIRKKCLSERWHICDCGYVTQRDHAASQIILARGLASVGAIP